MQAILDQVDSYRSYGLRSDINKPYLASHKVMFSDGEIHSTMTSDGYVQITSITNNPSYILYVDVDGDVTLDYYQNIPDNKFDEIGDRVIMMRQQTGIPYHGKKKLLTVVANTAKQDPTPNQTQAVAVQHPSVQKKPDVIDVNTFVCPECKKKPIFYDAGHGSLLAKCVDCGIEYTLVPSRYYVLESKRTTNKDKGIYARHIKIEPTLKTIKS